MKRKLISVLLAAAFVLPGTTYALEYGYGGGDPVPPAPPSFPGGGGNGPIVGYQYGNSMAFAFVPVNFGVPPNVPASDAQLIALYQRLIVLLQQYLLLLQAGH